ncbi:rab9 effector protein with kelch motifs [Erpetoichthys calabaricus]|uniref:rab9 effector protein with kelch motifs n=1 Tax=Erpetoichthys calabaricus TaxID=27687 RepID=UPI002234957C|nr:rab9 effector protein with kelch motifs [Erpetoichthys calabaricus]
MGLLQVLDPEDTPEKGVWYALVPSGEGPGIRVGHTCVYIPETADACSKGRIIITGGANPSGTFSDSYILDLDKHEWDNPEWEGLLPRYEHASFVPEQNPKNIWVFGGAEQSGNRNCLQSLDLEAGRWKSVKVSGVPPSARTYHTFSASIGDRLYVFSGGDVGAEPVQDVQLHAFDTVTSTWSQVNTQGKPPSPRHGHVVVAVGAKLFIHGGLSGDRFYNDMYSINTDHMKWEKVKAKGDIPIGCAAHSAASLGKFIYVFGGLSADGALNSMYKFHTDKQHWTFLRFSDNSPSKRLDHAMCVIPWRLRSQPCALHSEADFPTEKQMARAEAVDASALVDPPTHKQEMVHLCLIFGGMDTEGNVFNDCAVTILD